MPQSVKSAISLLGMKQRLGIAAALINSPKVIILDEPANGLDPEGMASLRKLLRQLASDEKRTIFVSSHLLHEIEQICDEIAIINEGRVEAIGKVCELLSNKLLILEAEPRDKAYTILSKSFKEIDVEKSDYDESLLLHVPPELTPRIVKELVVNKIDVHKVANESTRLEDFFREVVSKEKGNKKC